MQPTAVRPGRITSVLAASRAAAISRESNGRPFSAKPRAHASTICSTAAASAVLPTSGAQECHEASRQLFERGTPTASAGLRSSLAASAHTLACVRACGR